MLDVMTWTASDPLTRWRGGGRLAVAEGVAGLRTVMVNVYFVDHAVRPDGQANGWVLIDAGLPMTAHSIRQAAEERYGSGAAPEAILLTHGHFDHIGALEQLAAEWDVPVYAHSLEMPYLNGTASYAPPDPWVGGAMALTSRLYPRGPIDLGERLRPLPADGSVPHLPGWRWIFTPGHSPGHVSFFRESDRVLLAGDAFVTTRQESLLAVLAQARNVCGPPRYFTHNWQAAEQSVRALAELNPAVAATGHGVPMSGQKLTEQLQNLAANFQELEVPSHGRYAHHPVEADESGPTVVPAARVLPTVVSLAAVGLIAAAAAYAILESRPSNRRHL